LDLCARPRWGAAGGGKRTLISQDTAQRKLELVMGGGRWRLAARKIIAGDLRCQTQISIRKILRHLGRSIQAFLSSLLQHSPDVTGIEFQHFADTFKPKNPIFIAVKNPLRRFPENSFAGPVFCTTILEIAVDRILKDGGDKFYFWCMGVRAPVDMKIIMDGQDVGLVK
jgi:hypothetical protein